MTVNDAINIHDLNFCVIRSSQLFSDAECDYIALSPGKSFCKDGELNIYITLNSSPSTLNGENEALNPQENGKENGWAPLFLVSSRMASTSITAEIENVFPK
jgi:hypothetical protein